ncbi:MAG: nicotinamide-nucleotide amidohydrolase family protein [Bacteriovoracia bacterium]
MKLGMLVIGSELLQGKIADANTPWFAQYLRAWNTTLTSVLITHDEPVALKKALTQIFETCDAVICSGGLGPTLDDITKASLGDFFHRSMKTSAHFQEVAKNNYARMGRELALDHAYNFAPEGFTTLNNPSGFAPGLYFAEKGKSVFALPGVPKEFRDMLSEHFPALMGKSLEQNEKMQLLNFRTRGVPEEKIFFELCPGLWDELVQFGSVSSLPHVLGVDVGVTIKAMTDSELSVKAQNVSEIIKKSPLKNHLWHEGFSSLEEVIMQKALAKKLTISFAESCTGGLCSHRLTQVSGISQVFWGSVVSYDNSVKEKVLHVKADTIQKHGAVSEHVAMEMAQGVRLNLKTSIGVSLTGIAGPMGGTEEKPVGTVWIGFSTAEKTYAKKFQFKGDRENLKLRFSQMAFYELLDNLQD